MPDDIRDRGSLVLAARVVPQSITGSARKCRLSSTSQFAVRMADFLNDDGSTQHLLRDYGWKLCAFRGATVPGALCHEVWEREVRARFGYLCDKYVCGAAETGLSSSTATRYTV